MTDNRASVHPDRFKWAELFGPGNVPGYLTGGDIESIKKLCEMIPHANMIVEIGSFFGKSTVEFATHLPDAKIIAIDSFDTPPEICESLLRYAEYPLPPHAKTHQEIFEYYTKDYLNIRGVQGYFGPKFGFPGEIDLVFEDSTHEIDYLTHALPFWWDKIKIGGILSGHDYTTGNVKTAVDLFAAVNDLTVECFHDPNNQRRNDSMVWYIRK